VRASWLPNRLDVFGLGQDHSLWHRWWDGNAWVAGSPWAESSLTTPPWFPGPNRLDIFGAHRQRVWHRWWDGNAWGGWESLGGSVMSE